MARSRKRPPAAATERLILDSGAVIAWSRLDLRVQAFVRQAREDRVEIEIPVVVVAETMRGGGPRAAAVNRILNAVEVPPATEEIGRLAGSLLAAASSSATVDAMVVAQAIAAGGARILTSDPDDLAALAANHSEVTIHAL